MLTYSYVRFQNGPEKNPNPRSMYEDARGGEGRAEEEAPVTLWHGAPNMLIWPFAPPKLAYSIARRNNCVLKTGSQRFDPLNRPSGHYSYWSFFVTDFSYFSGLMLSSNPLWPLTTVSWMGLLRVLTARYKLQIECYRAAWCESTRSWVEPP
jgi:hypothetical protein